MKTSRIGQALRHLVENGNLTVEECNIIATLAGVACAVKFDNAKGFVVSNIINDEIDSIILKTLTHQS